MTTDTDMITVKVIRVPGAVTEVALNAGATIADALAAANMSTSATESIKLGAAPADVSTVVSNGDRVVVSQGAKGN